MNRVPFILSAIAVAVLAGCATESGITSAPAPVVTAPAAAPAPVAAAPAAPTYSVGAAGTTVVIPNAAVGGTAPNPSKRIAMRMEDGTVQHFDTNADGLAVGDRIEITGNGTMRHPA
jgi:hypothetical protein